MARLTRLSYSPKRVTEVLFMEFIFVLLCPRRNGHMSKIYVRVFDRWSAPSGNVDGASRLGVKRL
jgi:hypothetical protein